ncbi:MAG: hypothetical protein CMM01_16890 [Rhodopirellula sp.]|nr:hypothetical protein [Rhodopirellula sp.]
MVLLLRNFCDCRRWTSGSEMVTTANRLWRSARAQSIGLSWAAAGIVPVLFQAMMASAFFGKRKPPVSCLNSLAN